MMCQTVITHVVVLCLCALMGTLSYLAYGNLIQDIVLYNLPQHSNLGTFVAVLYMLNIVGSITMTIQPIYGLFEKVEKRGEAAENQQALPQQPTGNQGGGNFNGERGSIHTNDASTEIISDNFSNHSGNEAQPLPGVANS